MTEEFFEKAAAELMLSKNLIKYVFRYFQNKGIINE